VTPARIVEYGFQHPPQSVAGDRVICPYLLYNTEDVFDGDLGYRHLGKGGERMAVSAGVHSSARHDDRVAATQISAAMRKDGPTAGSWWGVTGVRLGSSRGKLVECPLGCIALLGCLLDQPLGLEFRIGRSLFQL
jgi:hypothetical protein